MTPLGDPPLFLGFLHGVPFFWTMHILPEMAFASVVLLVSYFIMDSYFYKKESKPDAPDTEPEPLSIEGSYNFIFLAGIKVHIVYSGESHSKQLEIL